MTLSANELVNDSTDFSLPEEISQGSCVGGRTQFIIFFCLFFIKTTHCGFYLFVRKFLIKILIPNIIFDSKFKTKHKKFLFMLCF